MRFALSGCPVGNCFCWTSCFTGRCLFVMDVACCWFDLRFGVYWYGCSIWFVGFGSFVVLVVCMFVCLCVCLGLDCCLCLLILFG